VLTPRVGDKGSHEGSHRILLGEGEEEKNEK